MNEENGTKEKLKELDQMIRELAGVRRQISDFLAGSDEKIRKDKDIDVHAKNEKKWREWIDSLPQRIIVKDRNLSYVWGNRSYARDLNTRPDDLTGKNDLDFYPKELADKYTADDQRVMNTGATEEIEDRYFLSGEERTIYATRIPLKDENGTVTGIMKTFWDISDLKKAEEEPKKYIERLKRLVFERGIQIESLNDHLHKEMAERKRLEEELEKIRSAPEGAHLKSPAQAQGPQKVAGSEVSVPS